MKDRTMIPLEREVRKELKRIADYEGKTYNEVLKAMISIYNAYSMSVRK